MGSRASECEECGYEFAVEKRELVTVEGELVEIDRQAMARAKSAEQRKAETLEELITIGQRRGMKNPRGWAYHVLAARKAKRSSGNLFDLLNPVSTQNPFGAMV
jgi:hypothetical protein